MDVMPPFFERQGTAEVRHRAPTYRERWVKNDGSGTLGFLAISAVQVTGLRFLIQLGNHATSAESLDSAKLFGGGSGHGSLFVGAAHTRQGHCPCTHFRFAAAEKGRT